MPRVSVIMPVHQAGTMLPRSLAALLASDLPREQWELIVVDDASTDRSAEIAEGYADTVLRLEAPARGPAHARNRGTKIAQGDYLVFVDADVCIHPDVIRRFSDILADDPTVAGAFGAYDATPPEPGLVSQYRNLVHHYVHAHNAGDAETFWAGCGAIRHEVFVEVGMFDDKRYPRPQIEDIELGYRIRDAGHRIVLCPDIQGTHLKRWTLGTMIRNDLRDRGLPWMRLLLHPELRGRRATLNLRFPEGLYTAVIGMVGGTLVLAVIQHDPRWLLAGAAGVLLVLAGNAPLFSWFARRRGVWFMLGSIPLRLLYYALNGIAATVAAMEHLFGRESAERFPGARTIPLL